jgi:hypothetical protein
VRPETPLIAAALALDRAIARGAASTVRWAGVIAAIFAPFLVFRPLYFDSWLPNTYYAKTGAPVPHQVVMGWRYVQDFLAALAPIPGTGLASFLTGGILFAAVIVFAWRRPKSRVPAIVVTAVTAAAILEGGDWMALSRFLVPAMPCLAGTRSRSWTSA